MFCTLPLSSRPGGLAWRRSFLLVLHQTPGRWAAVRVGAWLWTHAWPRHWAAVSEGPLSLSTPVPLALRLLSPGRGRELPAGWGTSCFAEVAALCSGAAADDPPASRARGSSRRILTGIWVVVCVLLCVVSGVEVSLVDREFEFGKFKSGEHVDVKGAVCGQVGDNGGFSLLACFPFWCIIWAESSSMRGAPSRPDCWLLLGVGGIQGATWCPAHELLLPQWAGVSCGAPVLGPLGLPHSGAAQGVVCTAPHLHLSKQGQAVSRVSCAHLP